MKGKTKCPYCGEYVIIEIPDGATGIQTVTCPNCGMKIKVDVSKQEEKEEKEEEQPIHPTVQKIRPKNMLMAAGALLVIASILGIMMGGIFLSNEGIFYHGVGNYRGVVLNESHNAIEGARVYLDGNFSGVTDENGTFVLKNVSAGYHNLEIEKAGYDTLKAKIFVFPFKVFLSSTFIMHPGNGTEKMRDIPSYFMAILPVLSIALIVISTIPFIGAISCFFKKNFVVALISSIFGIFSIGFFIGSILSIIALIMIILGKDEFEGEVKY